MRVRVLTFAGVREVVGAGELVVELPEGAGLAELRATLDRDHPGLEAYWGRLAIAVDGRLGAETLSDGCEVALLPPVSGGNIEGGNIEGGHGTLTDAPIDTASVAARVASRGRGAVLVFEGRVRDSHRGRVVTHLDYDAYRPMAVEALTRIATELESGGDDLAVAIVHRLGEVPAGEPSVVIAVASPHRDAAYDASRQALERLKREVPIWKNEHYADGDSQWREEEPLDLGHPAPPRV